ncbi:TetR-like C-terminal domain-containing protein [Streptomyces sp. M19]
MRAQAHAYCRFALEHPGHYRLMYEVEQPQVGADRSAATLPAGVAGFRTGSRGAGRPDTGWRCRWSRPRRPSGADCTAIWRSSTRCSARRWTTTSWRSPTACSTRWSRRTPLLGRLAVARRQPAARRIRTLLTAGQEGRDERAGIDRR